MRQLHNQIAGIRMGATNASLWQKYDTLTEYTRQAINDALLMYPVKIGTAWYTAMVNTLGGRIGLPRYVDQVTAVRAVHSTYYDAVELPHYTVVPTINTVFLDVHDEYTGVVQVEYNTRITYAPKDTTLLWDSVLATETLLLGPDYSLPGEWPAPGYIETSFNTLGAEYRGVHWYTSVATAPYAGVLMPLGHRGVEGLKWPTGTTTTYWPAYSKVSYAFPDDQQLLAVTYQAQAALYDYLTNDRAAYDQWTGIASSQAMPLTDLMRVINAYEMRAARAHNIAVTREPIAPHGTHLRRPTLT